MEVADAIFKVVLFGCIQQVVIFIPSLTVQFSINGKSVSVILTLILTIESFFFSQPGIIPMCFKVVSLPHVFVRCMFVNSILKHFIARVC